MRTGCKSFSRTIFLSAMMLFASDCALSSADDLSPEERLGKSIFFDDNLSLGRNQSCAFCHDPEAGWTGKDSDVNEAGSVYEGSVAGRFGNRRPPTAAYATPSPVLGYEMEEGSALFSGGNFWDGRATGERLGNAAAEQAQAPFLNPVEQALPFKECVVYRVCNPTVPSDYPVTFSDVYGKDACEISWPPDIENVCSTEKGGMNLSGEDREKAAAAYDKIALAIGAFEGSSEVNAFSSKFDFVTRGEAGFTEKEKKGFELFKGKGKCELCHISEGTNALFTDFTYDNLGIPRNPENPWYGQEKFNPYGRSWVDQGLGDFLKERLDYSQFREDNLGKQKVPTLRNAGLGSCESGEEDCIVKAYAHNGYFKSLKSIVHFYNTRDTKKRCADPFTKEAEALAQNCWPQAEILVNVNTEELGNLGLTPEEEDAIVTFLMTLSDGYVPAEKND